MASAVTSRPCSSNTVITALVLLRTACRRLLFGRRRFVGIPENILRLWSACTGEQPPRVVLVEGDDEETGAAERGDGRWGWDHAVDVDAVRRDELPTGARREPRSPVGEEGLDQLADALFHDPEVDARLA
jgi:hypothetical protein